MVSVARLRLLKADHMSRRYQLEDQLLKTYPREVERCKDVIAGLEKDKAALAAHPLPEKEFVGMEIQGRLLTDGRCRPGEFWKPARARRIRMWSWEPTVPCGWRCPLIPLETACCSPCGEPCRTPWSWARTPGAT